MFKNIRNLTVGLLSAITLIAVPMALPSVASAAATGPADIQSGLCQGSGLSVTGGAGCGNTAVGTDKINGTITTIINVFSIVVGIVAVIMIIIGGFRYITSNGDSNNVSAAKNTIIYAIIGLVIVAFAQFIVQFVLNKLTS